MTWKEQEAQIEQHIQQTREHIQDRSREAMEHAASLRWDLESYPSTYGKSHPVWGEELRQDVWLERRDGIETGPPLRVEREERYYTMERWERDVEQELGR